MHGASGEPCLALFFFRFVSLIYPRLAFCPSLILSFLMSTRCPAFFKKKLSASVAVRNQPVCRDRLRTGALTSTRPRQLTANRSVGRSSRMSDAHSDRLRFCITRPSQHARAYCVLSIARSSAGRGAGTRCAGGSGCRGRCWRGRSGRAVGGCGCCCCD